MCVPERAAPSSAQSSKSSAIEHSNQFSWRRTSWKSTVPFTKNTNRNQDEWAGLANHTDYTDVTLEDWPESFGALYGSWAGGGLALAGAAGPPAGRAARRLFFPEERKTIRRRKMVREIKDAMRTTGEISRKLVSAAGQTALGMSGRRVLINHEDAAWQQNCECWNTRSSSDKGNVCVCVCVFCAHWWSCFLCSLASSLCFSL